MGIPVNEAYAETATNPEIANLQEVSPENDITQEEINRRMEIVLDYLNEHTQSADLNGQSSLTFNIPVGEGAIVTAEVANQKDLDLSAKTVGSDTFSITANTTYNYTLTLTNVIGSGDITKYTVNYTTGNSTDYGNGVYKLTVNSVSITGTPSGLYSVGATYTSIGSNNNIIVSTGGYIEYNHPILSDKTLLIVPVDMGSLSGGTLIVNYTYEV
ncbi:hypothetical protein D3C81_1449100 [compost metagenome]